MWVFTDIADGWDKQNTQTLNMMDAIDSYTGGIPIITSAMRVNGSAAAGMVDALRIGDGIREGGGAGWGN